MTALSLVLSSIVAFMPTIDGARQTDAYVYADLPYVLGISCPPPNATCITVMQDALLWSGLGKGTFTIGTITSSTPVLLYEDGVLEYTIVPEPASLLLLITAIFPITAIFQNRKTPICTKL